MLSIEQDRAVQFLNIYALAFPHQPQSLPCKRIPRVQPRGAFEQHEGGTTVVLGRGDRPTLERGVGVTGRAPERKRELVIRARKIAEAQRDVQIEQIKVGGAAAKAQQAQFALDQKYNQDARYVQNLAGNYANYAAGQAMNGAGQGGSDRQLMVTWRSGRWRRNLENLRCEPS